MPSRSEIEKALSGDSTTDKLLNQSTPCETQTSVRQQQVIGGDLKGIPERQKYGVWRRTLNRIDQASVINWLLGLIILLALIALFWPEKPSSIKTEVENKISAQERAIYTNSRLDEQDIRVQDNSFSRDNDLDRVTSFREQDAKDKKLRALIGNAEKLVTDGQYTLPIGNNALKTYREVLKLDENNASALQGIDYILGRFLSAGIDALTNNNEVGAINALDKLIIIDPESEQRYRMADEIEIWKQQQQIYNLIQQAQIRSDADKLIEPARDNAFYYFNQALSLDENNRLALDGIDAITNRFVEKTKTALLNKQILEAKGYLETIRIIAADNTNIKVLEELIADASASKKAQDAEANNRSADQDNEATTASFDQEANSSNTAESVSPEKTPTSSSETISETRTSSQQTSEQQAFDKQYLSLGLQAYENGDYASSIALLKPLADKGISQAQIRIANMVFAGQGVVSDKRNADALAKSALPAIQKFANEGRTWAQTELANLHLQGLGVTRNTQQALKWYLAAGNQGYPKAQAALGLIYLRGDGVLANRRIATLWLQRAAKQGDKSAIQGLRKIGIYP